MSYLVLARKWRPQAFEEVVGQAHVTRTLQNAISTSRVAHAYLFTGPRGVGKTSTARILAKALNCAKGPTPTPCGECDSCKEVVAGRAVDVIEIDGASNNSVDDIRDLREKVLYSGARDRHKVYIIDEVHMLTSAAFNALLKTLEEPPAHVIFIFATTEVQKVPETILSRTQRFDFRRISVKDLSGQLSKILQAEGVASSPEAVSLVARAAGGSMRDSQTLLDQVISYASKDGAKAVTSEDVLQVLGGVQESEALGALLPALQGECAEAFGFCARLYDRGADFEMAFETLQEMLRAVLLIKTSPQAVAELSGLLPDTLKSLETASEGLPLSRVLSMIRAAGEAESQLRYSAQPRLALELFFVKLGAARPNASLGEIYDELALLEKRLHSAPAAALQSPAPMPAEAAQPAAKAAPGYAVEGLEEAPAPAKAQALDMEAIKKGWENVVEKSAQISIFLGTCVRDAELASFDHGELLLRTRNPKQKETLDAGEQRRQLEDLIKGIFGQPIKLKVSLVQPEKAAPKAAAGGKPSAEEVEKLRKEIPALKRFEELFDAEITEIKRT